MARIRVLIVDDNVTLSQTMKAGLEQTGEYEVCVVNDPKRARSAALDFRPAVMILDVIMPEKDGGTVAAELREDPALCDIPVIFATSIVGKDEVVAMGGRMGEEPVLAKPVTMADLTACIRKTLRGA